MIDFKKINIDTGIRLEYVYTCVIGSTFFILISSYFLNILIKSQFVQLPDLFFSIIFGCFGIYILVDLFLTKTVKFNGTKFKTDSMLGFHSKEYLVKDIQHYIKRVNLYNASIIYILENKGKIVIDSSKHENYKAFETYVGEAFVRDQFLENKIEKRASLINYTIYFIIVLVLLAGIISTSIPKSSYRNELNIIPISGKIISDIKINDFGRGHRDIRLVLDNFPEFIFCLSNNIFDNCKLDLVTKKINKGDYVDIYVSLEAYLEKLEKNKAISFLEKHLNYQFICIYQLYDCSIQETILDKTQVTDSNGTLPFKFLWISIGMGMLVFFTYKLFKITRG